MPSDTTPPDKRTRLKRLTTIKGAKAIYSAVEKPDDMTDEEWALWCSNDVRKLIALLLGMEYMSHRDMIRAKKEEPEDD